MRKLEYYLATCEASFRLGGACVFQVQLARRHDRVPITRDYIAEYEALLRKRDGVEMVEAPLQYRTYHGPRRRFANSNVSVAKQDRPLSWQSPNSRSRARLGRSCPAARPLLEAE